LELAAGVAMALAAIGAGLPTTYVTGLFAGAMTSTAALQAAIEVSGSQDPAVGYSVAYPIGVVGPILCMYLFQVLLRPKIAAPGLRGLSYAEIALRNLEVAGRTLAELATRLPTGVMVAAVRQQHRNLVPNGAARSWLRPDLPGRHARENPGRRPPDSPLCQVICRGRANPPPARVQRDGALSSVQYEGSAGMKPGIIETPVAGGAAANTLVLTKGADEIILVDVRPKRAVAEAALHATAFAYKVLVRDGYDPDPIWRRTSDA
jgi:hypothetical protein